MSRQPIALVLSLVLTGTFLYGCGSNKRIESTEAPKQPQTTEPAPVATPVPVKSSKYQVAPHDTLWGIASKPDTYSDSFQWPLIFKSNRDIIKDPDLIYPKQEFKIEKGMAPEEVSKARKLAQDTPKYAPHSQPRQTLPLDYF